MLDTEDGPTGPGASRTVVDLTTPRRRRASLWLAVAGVTVLVAIVGAVALLEDHQTVNTAPATDVPAVTEPPNTGGPTNLVKAQDLNVVGVNTLAGRTLNVDAVEHDGEVTGEFRVDNVVVTVQCADTEGGDLILAGEVTDDPGGQGLVYAAQASVRRADGTWDFLGEKRVAEGDLVALVINEQSVEGGPVRQRVTLYAGESFRGNDNPRSCSELARSVPFLDGGYFSDVAGLDIGTGWENINPQSGP